MTLATTTIGSVSFTSIPTDGTYRDLVLVVEALSATGDSNIRISFNGDTTDANYSGVHMSGAGAFVDRGTLTGSQTRWITMYGYMTTTSRASILVNIQDASATDKHKTFLTKANNGATGTTAFAQRWANTAAINSISLLGDVSGFAAGTTFSLYGIAS